MNRIVVVGAGVAGLTCAQILSTDAHVTLVDRLPAAGGVLPFDHGVVRELVRVAKAADVEFALGSTATRWSGERLLIAAPHAIRWHAADHLVYCGGARPSTPAELRLTGVARVAGILAAPVAVHLLEAGVLIGRNVVVIGTGDWANRTMDELAHHSIRATSVGLPDDDLAHVDVRAREHYAGWSPIAAYGTGRISELMIERAGVTHRLVCDAVVLAAQIRPLRNIDGAVEDNATTTYIQHVVQRTTIEEVVAHAREASRAVIKQIGDP